MNATMTNCHPSASAQSRATDSSISTYPARSALASLMRLHYTTLFRLERCTCQSWPCSLVLERGQRRAGAGQVPVDGHAVDAAHRRKVLVLLQRLHWEHL